MTVPQTYVQTC